MQIYQHFRTKLSISTLHLVDLFLTNHTHWRTSVCLDTHTSDESGVMLRPISQIVLLLCSLWQVYSDINPYPAAFLKLLLSSLISKTHLYEVLSMYFQSQFDS